MSTDLVSTISNVAIDFDMKKTSARLLRATYTSQTGVVHGRGMKIRRKAKRGDVLLRHHVSVVCDDAPTARAVGTDHCAVDDAIGGVYIYAPTPDGRPRRVVLVPHYGRPVPTFYINQRARANIRVVLDGNTLSVVCDVAWIRAGAELFWSVACISKSTMDPASPFFVHTEACSTDITPW